jgi:hypothetical protein
MDWINYHHSLYFYTIAREGSIAKACKHLHLDGEYRWNQKWRFNLNMDGLVAKQGRAFDIALKLTYDFAKNWTLAAGYHMLEGGADVKDVYAFAWLHYAVSFLAFRF